jgi:hypothetical protein
MVHFSNRAGKDGDIYIVPIFVRTLIGESHDPIQESVYVLFLIMDNSFQRGTAAVPLYKNL